MHSQIASPKEYCRLVSANSDRSPNRRGRKWNGNLIAYRNAEIVGEVTVQLHHNGGESFGNDRLTMPDSQARTGGADFQHLLAEILMKAGIISRCDIFEAQNVARSSDARESFTLIVHKFSNGVLTFDQAVVAVNHIHLTGTFLAEALALVSSSRAPLICDTVINFLELTGLVTEENINKLCLKQPIEPKLLADCLVAANVIDGNTLRNAIRLRYLLNHGEIGLTQAANALRFCATHGIDAEEYLT